MINKEEAIEELVRIWKLHVEAYDSSKLLNKYNFATESYKISLKLSRLSNRFIGICDCLKVFGCVEQFDNEQEIRDWFN